MLVVMPHQSTMIIAVCITSLLLALLVYRSSRPYWCHGSERDAVRTFINTNCEQDVDDGIIGPQTNCGVTRSIRFVCSLDDGRTSLFLVESHFFRGGCPEHDRVYLLSIDRRSKEIVECVTIESSLPAKVVTSTRSPDD